MIFVLYTSVFMTLVFIFNVFFHLMRGGRCHGFMYQINRKRGHQEVGTKLQHEEALRFLCVEHNKRLMEHSNCFPCLKHYTCVVMLLHVMLGNAMSHDSAKPKAAPRHGMEHHVRGWSTTSGDGAPRDETQVNPTRRCTS